MNQTDWVKILEESWIEERQNEQSKEMSRLEFLGEYIFDFITYDGEASEKFAAIAIEVCRVINDSQTFEFIKDSANYFNYLLMVNMPFFRKRLEWGCSIRGVWWQLDQELICCSLLIEGEYPCEFKFTQTEWEDFISALIQFAEKDSE